MKRVRPRNRLLRWVVASALALVAAAFMLLGLTFWYFNFAPKRWRFATEIAETEAARNYVEQYRAKNGTLPSERQVPQGRNEGQIFSTPRNDGSYMIGFNVGLDDWYAIDSRSGRWSFEK